MSKAEISQRLKQDQQLIVASLCKEDECRFGQGFLTFGMELYFKRFFIGFFAKGGLNCVTKKSLVA
ncbi:MAG: hypothetical protein IJS50_06425 [Desulfovibrio sp.]|nr:hypothetical protein [Desulfovibrio sp.]